MDESGRVLAAELTDRRVADAEMLPGLMDQVGRVGSLADRAAVTPSRSTWHQTLRWS